MAPSKSTCQIMREVLSSARLKLNSPLFFTMGMKRALCVPAFKNSAIRSRPRQPLQTDNSSTAAGIANNSVKQNRSKAIDMHFYWICDRVRQGQFLVYTGKKASSTRQITSQSIIVLPHIAKQFVLPIYTRQATAPKIISNAYKIPTTRPLRPVTRAASPVTRAATFAANVTKQFAARVC
jgi:hypothetical protein